MDRSTEAAKLSTPAAIYWTAICWAKANGYRGFDLGGVTEEAVRALEDDPTDSSGLTGSEVFKASFGAVPFRYPTPVELISSRPVRMAYDVSQRWPATRRLVNRATHLLRASRGKSR
jgi:lipid II:glycine glycyltransferase (peptidoglycan interpeptide bridge formation enzyme)